MNADTLTNGQKTALWVVGALHELIELALIVAPDKITPAGLALWDQVDRDFRPRDDSIRSCLQVLFPETDPLDFETVLGLLRRFRDDREILTLQAAVQAVTRFQDRSG